jgi:uncharacterized protein YdhG (YjbR/CyaY superfamily)
MKTSTTKKHPGKDRSSAKSKITPKTIDDYMARVPQPARGTLGKVRAAIRAAAPAETTEAISYGIPAFKYKGMLVWFAAFAEHCSFFPGSKAVMKQFEKELKNFETSKGTIRFPVDKPLSAALVKKIVKARIAEKNQKRR